MFQLQLRIEPCSPQEQITMITREDGYLPLSSYGFLADGHAGALVAADGASTGLPRPG
jgi:hypothetical protein